MLPMLFTALTFPLPQNSTYAADVDALYNFIYWVSVVCLVPTTIAMVYFGIKYHKDKNKDAVVPYIHGNALFEWTVSTVLSVVFIIIFVWGLIGYNRLQSPPENSYEIN